MGRSRLAGSKEASSAKLKEVKDDDDLVEVLGGVGELWRRKGKPKQGMCGTL